MRQFTTEQQTAKLIELRFEKPESIEEFIEPENDWSIGGLKQRKAYSIGELISILPSTVGKDYDLHIEFSGPKWYVAYYLVWYDGEPRIKYEFFVCELIDALYMMILKLKEEGVI